MNFFGISAPVLITAMLLGGCTSTANFSHTPTASAEFSKDFTQLKREYSDIEEYGQSFRSLQSLPPADELNQIWGPPQVRKQWGGFALGLGVDAAIVAAGYLSAPVVGVLILLNPTPNEEYVWEKGRYTITAQGHQGALVGYEKRIVRWEWAENSSSGNVALNVKQAR